MPKSSVFPRASRIAPALILQGRPIEPDAKERKRDAAAGSMTTSLYTILTKANAVHTAIHADYPDIDDARCDDDPRWEDWHKLIDQAKASAGLPVRG